MVHQADWTVDRNGGSKTSGRAVGADLSCSMIKLFHLEGKQEAILILPNESLRKVIKLDQRKGFRHKDPSVAQSI